MNSNAVNVSLTRLREYERGHSRNYFVVFEIILFIMIIGLLMITLGSGVNVYRNISDQRWADEQSRTGLTLISNSVHITDTIDAVGVGNGPEGQALVLTEVFSTGSYETRIYLYEGNIVEEYAVAGMPYTPERAAPLVKSDSFAFSYANNLLTVNTDHGNVDIMLHSVRKAGSETLSSQASDNAKAATTNDNAKAATASEDDAKAATASEDDVKAKADTEASGGVEDGD